MSRPIGARYRLGGGLVADELEIRAVCPGCGRVDVDAGWRGEAERLDIAYLGPAVDGRVLARRDRAVDVHVPCADCLERHRFG